VWGVGGRWASRLPRFLCVESLYVSKTKLSWPLDRPLEQTVRTSYFFDGVFDRGTKRLTSMTATRCGPLFFEEVAQLSRSFLAQGVYDSTRGAQPGQLLLDLQLYAMAQEKRTRFFFAYVAAQMDHHTYPRIPSLSYLLNLNPRQSQFFPPPLSPILSCVMRWRHVGFRPAQDFRGSFM
jgi:hypothetical protein